MRFSRIGLVGIAALLGFATLACSGDDDSSLGDLSTENGSDSGDTGDSDDDSGDDNGGGGGGDRDALIESLSESAAEDGDFTEEEIGCMMPGMVDAIGVERLVEAGAIDNPDADFEELGLDITDEEGEAMFEAVNGCVDLRETFVSSMTEDGSATQEQAECLSDAIDDDLFKTLMVTSLVEGDEGLDANTELKAAVQEAAVQCMSPGG